ncbi:hypothetical protein COCCADRAFT_94955, partial [Bipolaris zeicola 26-R-13]
TPTNHPTQMCIQVERKAPLPYHPSYPPSSLQRPLNHPTPDSPFSSLHREQQQQQQQQ